MSRLEKASVSTRRSLEGQRHTISCYSQSQLHPHMLKPQTSAILLTHFFFFFFLHFAETCLTIGIRCERTSNQATGTLFHARLFIFRASALPSHTQIMSRAHMCGSPGMLGKLLLSSDVLWHSGRERSGAEAAPNMSKMHDLSFWYDECSTEMHLRLTPAHFSRIFLSISFFFLLRS